MLDTLSRKRTIQASVIGLNVSLLDSTVLNDQGIALGAVTAKDGSAIEGEIQGFRESQAWVT